MIYIAYQKLIAPITFVAVKIWMQSVSLFMSAIILLQSAFCWIVVCYLWNQNMHAQKELMEKNIPVEKLTLINFKKTKGAIRINKKEITVNGEWFDIVSKTGTGDNEIFYCISDKKESEIMSLIEKDKNNTGKQGLVSFMKSLNKEYPPLQVSNLDTGFISVTIYHSETEKGILSGYQTILYSPPDFTV